MTGPVGTGKSWFSVLIGDHWERGIVLEESLVYDVPQLFNKVYQSVRWKGKPLTPELVRSFVPEGDIEPWLMEEYSNGNITHRIGKVVIFDETAKGANVREFWSDANRDLSKLLGLFRFLRMVVIFVVPHNMGQAEKNIRNFMNIEVQFKAKGDGEATCRAYECFGMNNYTKEPIRKTLPGCRYGGFIHVKPLRDEIAEEYNKVSFAKKMSAIYSMQGRRGRRKEKQEDTIPLESHIEKVLKNVHDYMGKRSLSKSLIKVKLNVNRSRAEEIHALVQKKIEDKVLLDRIKNKALES